jgi:hypothetical protein
MPSVGAVLTAGYDSFGETNEMEKIRRIYSELMLDRITISSSGTATVRLTRGHGGLYSYPHNRAIKTAVWCRPYDIHATEAFKPPVWPHRICTLHCALCILRPLREL